nr:ATP-binding protein [Streptosporangium sp. NBC_01495]
MTSRHPTYTSDDLSRIFTLSPVPASAPMARMLVRQTLIQWEITHFQEQADLLVTELTANAVRHARVGDASVKVLLTYAAGTLRIEVRDRDRTTLPIWREPGSEEETGRGLLIVDACADRWGVRLAESGKTVWCELATPSSDR